MHADCVQACDLVRIRLYILVFLCVCVCVRVRVGARACVRDIFAHIHVHDLFDQRHHNGNSDSYEAQETQGDDALEISHVPAKTRTRDAATEDAAVVVEVGHASLTA